MKNYGAINSRFNRELERYKAGYMLPNEVFHLGKPQGVLKLFLPNLPIIMRPRVMRKGNIKKHSVELFALKNMPQFIAEPIFVFQRDDKSIGILTEMKDTFLKVNDIRSFHGREIENIIKPLLLNQTLIWVDKKKGLDWLSSASQPVQQELTPSILSNVANIINKFDNPKIPKDYIREVDISVLDRITDVTVYPLRNKGYAIRCKVDGVQQLAIELLPEDAAKVNPYMDKKLLATKYYKEELDLNEFQEQEQTKGMKI